MAYDPDASLSDTVTAAEPETHDPLNLRLRQLREMLGGADPGWPGWDTLDAWLADVGRLAAAKRNAREERWRRCGEDWARACAAEVLGDLWEGSPPAIPETWRGDVAAAAGLHTELVEVVGRGARALEADRDARGPTARREARARLEEVERALSRVMADMRALLALTGGEASAHPEPDASGAAPAARLPFGPDDRASGVELRPATPPTRPRTEETPPVVLAPPFDGSSGASSPLAPKPPEPDGGRAPGRPEGAEGPQEVREGSPETRPDAGTVAATPPEAEVAEATGAGTPTTPGTGSVGDAPVALEGPQSVDPPVEPMAHVPTPAGPPRAAASATAPPIARVASVPEELRSYDAFREAYWSAPDGQCAPAPWRDPAFADRLRARAERMLGEEAPELAWLWLLARAGELLGVDELLSPADVRALDALRQAPEAPEAGASGERGPDLHEAVRAGTVTPRAVWRWRLLLEALRPSRDAPLPWEAVQTGCEAAGIPGGPLQELLVGLATLNAGGEDGAAVVRAALRDRPGDPEAIAHDLTAARQAYYAEVIARWNAGGGYIMTSHSRRAWGLFMDAVGASLKRLYPPEHGGLPGIDATAERAWVHDLPRTHARLADREGAKFNDRARMDRLVERFQADATRILALARRLQTAQADRGARPELGRVLPAVEALRLRVEARPSAPPAQTLAEPGDERAMAAFALGCLGTRPFPATRTDSTELDDADVRRYPDLLRLLGPGAAPATAGGPALRFDVSEIADPRRAAAILLAATPQELGDLTALVRWLEARGEHALLGPLLPALGVVDQHRLHLRRQQALDHLGRLVDELGAVRHHLAEMAHPATPAWRDVVECARAFLQEPARLPGDLTLAHRWLERALDAARRAQADAVADLRVQAQARDAALYASIGRALDEQRYADALRMMGDHAPMEEIARPRETPWRWEARRLYPAPRDAVERFDGNREFAQVWRGGILEKNQRLRRLFRDVMFQGLEVPADTVYLRAEGADVRRWLARQRRNPSGLSQLADHGALVVLTPPCPPHDPNFVRAVAGQVSTHAGDLVAVLAPRISAEVRGRVLAEFRERRCKAAVVDDLDLCRLLNPGGERPVPVVALLEVILEQQRWSDVSPFRLGDGQSVRVEMYFGRADEARKLSREGHFSRLFSGRKLGKSALLRFVEQTEDGEALPSGLRLRVVYVSAAGIDAERPMVEAILRALEERCPTGGEPEGPDGEPAERLERALRRHLTEHPDESLLFFLDEADVFVEQQLRLYAERAERILSFAMRSRMESILDRAGLQRVRFVFTGYRVTNTTRGAWGNWGDVLRLRPLEPQDAADLIVRPLARLGIDARPQARSIAHRCGYQPAVLLRFGEQLLAHLEGTHPAHRRDQGPVEVGPDDVAMVFDGDRVRTEIVQVVRNNFQGNDVGEVVHAVMLLEFLGLPPGRALPDAGAAVLQNLLRLSDGDLRWFTPEGSTPEAEVAHHLRDLVERQLLVVRREGTGEAHALRFPHLLPVLLHLADERELRERIQTLRHTVAAATGTAAVEGALAERDIEELRAYLHPAGRPVGDLRVLPVVVSHWPTPLVDARVGLEERLGVRPERAFHPHGPRVQPLPARLPDEPALVLGVRAGDVADVLDRLPPVSTPALVGGADLLRWALVASGLPEDAAVEVFSDGRWGRARVAWWFQRVRALEFEVPRALDQLYARTSGIPLLLASFDRTFHHTLGLADGETVSAADWQRALEAFESALPEVARSLTGQDVASALTARELDLLRMLALVRDADDPRSVREHLTELWMYYRVKLDVEPVSPEEWPSMGLLQRLGLVPATPRRGSPGDRLQQLPTGDALHALLKHLPR